PERREGPDDDEYVREQRGRASRSGRRTLACFASATEREQAGEHEREDARDEQEGRDDDESGGDRDDPGDEEEAVREHRTPRVRGVAYRRRRVELRAPPDPQTGDDADREQNHEQWTDELTRH